MAAAQRAWPNHRLSLTRGCMDSSWKPTLRVVLAVSHFLWAVLGEDKLLAVRADCKGVSLLESLRLEERRHGVVSRHAARVRRCQHTIFLHLPLLLLLRCRLRRCCPPHLFLRRHSPTLVIAPLLLLLLLLGRLEAPEVLELLLFGVVLQRRQYLAQLVLRHAQLPANTHDLLK